VAPLLSRGLRKDVRGGYEEFDLAVSRSLITHNEYITTSGVQRYVLILKSFRNKSGRQRDTNNGRRRIGGNNLAWRDLMAGVAIGSASRATAYPVSQASVSLILVVPMSDHMLNVISSNQSALKFTPRVAARTF
jgi:hypothetical protein